MIQVVNLLWKKAFVSGGEEDMENLKDTFPEIWHREVASMLTTSPDSLWATKKMTGAEVSNGASVLFHQSHLTRLPLLCTPDSWRLGGTPYTEEETRRVFEELRPPPCREEELWIDGFFGRRFPSWKMSSLGTSFPRLTRLFRLRCELCQQLPSLGRLPQLKYLHITAASATSSLETRRRKQHPPLSSRSSKQFPIEDMPNLETWNLDGSGDDEDDGGGQEHYGAPQTLLRLPRLEDLVLRNCPNLSALPTGTNGVHKVRTFPALSRWTIHDCSYRIWTLWST
ncbi:hypothetical protein B296_00045834 [Ensete ventricosum]|uniref:R13L1/DRL21-like LRR repeat region domain-containing protein n=1 Tax=Ensete ventricosum TaxID=4639 RepID=A0A426YVJ4_ENSVE|nr:hypothetical protein B296_00045834 [Ensete ventricosum]